MHPATRAGGPDGQDHARAASGRLRRPGAACPSPPRPAPSRSCWPTAAAGPCGATRRVRPVRRAVSRSSGCAHESGHRLDGSGRRPAALHLRRRLRQLRGPPDIDLAPRASTMTQMTRTCRRSTCRSNGRAGASARRRLGSGRDAPGGSPTRQRLHRPARPPGAPVTMQEALMRDGLSSCQPQERPAAIRASPSSPGASGLEMSQPARRARARWCAVVRGQRHLTAPAPRPRARPDDAARVRGERAGRHAKLPSTAAEPRSRRS